MDLVSRDAPAPQTLINMTLERRDDRESALSLLNGSTYEGIHRRLLREQEALTVNPCENHPRQPSKSRPRAFRG